jgi:hypothetical protein
MGERVCADIQAAYELRSGWKIKDAISGLVIEIDVLPNSAQRQVPPR